MCRLHVEEIGVVECDIFGVEPWDHRWVDGVDRFGHRESRLGLLRVVECVSGLEEVRGYWYKLSLSPSDERATWGSN